MPFWAGGGGGGPGATIPTVHLWDRLGDYEAAIAEASHVFNFAAIDFDDDSILILVIDGSATLALALQLRINTIATASYNTDGYFIRAGAQTLIDLNGQTTIEIGSATIINGVNRSFFGEVKIGLNKSGTLDRPKTLSSLGTDSGSGTQVVNGLLDSAEASLTDIEVRTSVSTWQIGTRMTLYRIQRAPYQNAPT